MTEPQRVEPVRHERKVKRYPSDPSDQEWQAIKPLLQSPARTGRRCITDVREVLDAIRYLVRTGCEWAHVAGAFSALANGVLAGFGAS